MAAKQDVPVEDNAFFNPMFDNAAATKFEIHAACRDGRIVRVEQLLKENPKLVNRFDSDGRLPIHWAVAYYRLDIVQFLMDQPKFDIDVPDELGWTPLMIACSRRDGDDLVELLLARDPDVNMTDNLKQTSLHFAVSKDRHRVVDLLLKKKASVTMTDHLNRIALHRAASIGSIRVMTSLLAQSGQLNRSDADGMTALHHAIAEGHVDAAILLLEEGADSSKLSRDGRLAIQMSNDITVAKRISERAKGDGIEITLPGDAEK